MLMLPPFSQRDPPSQAYLYLPALVQEPILNENQDNRSQFQKCCRKMLSKISQHSDIVCRVESIKFNVVAHTKYLPLPDVQNT